MADVPAPRPPEVVRLVVDDVSGIAELVEEAALRARESDRALELVETAVPAYDHAARARAIRLMDEALDVARRAAPGLQVRVGTPIELPSPRRPT